MASDGEGLKLVGTKLSPFVTRVMASLSLKGINYEFVEEDLQNKSQLLLQSNPVHKKIPVLIRQGKPLCESRVIMEYIEETWASSPYPLLPSDPYERAIARFWATFTDDQLFDSLKKIYTNRDKELQAKGVEEARANVAFLEEALKSVGNGKTYFGGQNVGFVDLVFGSHYGSIKATETLAEVSLINEKIAPALSALLRALERNQEMKELLTDGVLIAEILRKRYHSQPCV